MSSIRTANLFRSLGYFIKNIYEQECSSYPYRLAGHVNMHILEADAKVPTKIAYAGGMAGPVKVAVSVIENNEFVADDKTWLVGYDTEFQNYKPYYDTDGQYFAPPSKMLSHQWYFNFQGVRFGVVFLTNHRITQAQFVKMFSIIVPKLDDPGILRAVIVYAFFSLAESGWMPSKMRLREVSELFSGEIQKRYVPWIAERDKQWYGYSLIREYLNGWYRNGEPKMERVNLLFADAKNLQSGNLAALGKTIGIPKLEHEYIEQMEWYRDNRTLEFCNYAINDSIIAAEAHLYFYWMANKHTGVEKPRIRMTAYSADVFTAIFKKHFSDNKDQRRWKLLLGYERHGKSIKMTLIHKAFVQFYFGGRNEVFEVGPRGTAYYHDLHSAYLTSVIMLIDYNFSAATVWHGEKALKRAKKLAMAPEGPFQPFGVVVSFRFREKVNGRDVQPIFPARINQPEIIPKTRQDFRSDGLIFPKSGHSAVSWPEFWVAYTMDLLEDFMIHELVEFEKLESHHLSDEVYDLLKKRAGGDKNEKLFMKNILNYFYGKTAQGVADVSAAIKSHELGKKVSSSAMTCYPLASYITGFCRATVGELLQLNQCFGITTDGFITQVSRDELQKGELCRRVEEKVIVYDSNNELKPFIGTDAEGDQSLFLKTRGYIIIKDGKATKIALMGAQVNKSDTIKSVTDFVEQLQKGRGNKKFFPSLAALRKRQRTYDQASPDMEVYENAKLNMTFDMKRVPNKPKIRAFIHNGKKYPFVSFTTKPLETVLDFHVLRSLAHRDILRPMRKNYKFWAKFIFEQTGFIAKKPEDLLPYAEVMFDAPFSPKYMRIADYREMLEEYRKYQHGK